jgi:hypothetical protein
MIAIMTTYLRSLSSSSLALYLLSSDPTRDALQKITNHFSRCVEWSTAIVALGVALEVVEPIHDAFAWIKRLHRKKRELADLIELSKFVPVDANPRLKQPAARPDHPALIKWCSRIGIILVVVGVIGEWRCGAKLEDAHNAIHEYDVGKLIEAGREAAQGRTWALHHRPRYTSFDHTNFVASLQGVSPQKVDVLYKPESEESYTLAFAITIALGPGKGNAGWNVSGPRPVTEKDALFSGDFLSHSENVPLIMRAGGSGGCGVVLILRPMYRR